MVKVLFVCLGNICRSPMAEFIFRDLLKKEGFDYIIGMDEQNIQDIYKICDGDYKQKVHKLLYYTDEPRDIADPWYTGNFSKAYDDILKGCTALLKYIKKSELTRKEI